MKIRTLGPKGFSSNLLAATLSALLAALSPLGLNPASAATYSWDPVADGSASGGTGTWDPATANWTNGGVPDSVWGNSGADTAVFGGVAGGTVTLSGTMSALGIQFLTTGYTLQSGTLVLGSGGVDGSGLSSGTTALSGPIVLGANQSWNAGGGSAIASSGIISGASALTFNGGGKVTLSGANTFTGGVVLNSGTLLLGSGAGAGTGIVSLNGGTFGASGAQTVANTIVANANTSTTLLGTGKLTISGNLLGSGTLNVGSSGVGLTVGDKNSTNQAVFNKFTGAINVGGVLNFESPNSANGADYYYNLSNAAFAFTSGGSTAWNAPNGSNTNDPGVLYANLGSLSSASGIGSIGTTNGGGNKISRFIVGTLNTDTTYGGTIVTSILGTSLVKVGTGTLILTGANTYAGGSFGTFSQPATTIRGGTLQVGDGTSGSLASNGALTFLDSGRFNYQGQTAGSSQTLGALTFSQGAGTVQSTYGTSGNTLLTFGSLAARGTGATGNFVVSGGSNGSSNKIVFTTAPTLSSAGIMDKGFFFGGSSYAAYDATNSYVRAYGSGDANYAAASGANGITSSATSNVALTGDVTAQTGATVNTLNMGANNLALASGTFQTNGILVSGNSGSTISGGAGLTASSSGAEMVIRVDGASDGLNISTPVIANGASVLTKTGAGTLTLSGLNTYTGPTYVDEGTLTLSGTNTVNTGIVNVNNSATLNLSGAFTTSGAVTIGNGSGNGVLNVNSGGALTLSGVLQISSSGNGADTGSGTVNVNGGTISSNNDITVGLGGTQTGTLNLNSGTVNIGTTTLRWFKLGQFDTANGVVNMNGGNLNLNFNSDIKFSVNSGAGSSVFNQNVGNVTVWSGNGTGTTGSAADGLVDMQYAASLANNTYNLNGGTLTVNQVKSTATNGTRTFNFNGGTLKAFSGSAATFFNLGAGNATANVRNNGAIIDSNGFNITVSQPLVHSNISGDNATDGGLTKNGAGTLTLTGTNTFNGGTTITGGTLALGGANVLLGTGAVNVNGGALNIAANNNAVGAVTMQNGGIQGTTGVLTASSYSMQSGTASAILAGNAGLTKSTAGSVALTGVNTYSGATTVNGGALTIGGAGSINSSSGISVNGSGAKFVAASSVPVTPDITVTQGTLDGTGTVGAVTVGAGTGGVVSNGNGSTATLTLGSLSFGGAAAINLNKVSDTATAGLAVTGALSTNSASGTVTINFQSQPAAWVTGSTYNLISYGSFGGAASDFTLGTIAGLGARQSGSLTSTGAGAGYISLVIGGDTPFWTGAQSNSWTANTVGGSQNWKLVSQQIGTEFLSNDQVLFNDNATGSTWVDISDSNVQVASVIFDNNAKDYTVSTSGGYGITNYGAAANISKSGTGTVTLATDNSFGSGSVTVSNGRLILSGNNAYTGPTNVSGGTLVLQNQGALGSTSGVSVANGGALELQDVSMSNVPLTLSGSGSSLDPEGALRNVSGTNIVDGVVSLGGNATIQSDADTLIVSGSIVTAGNTLTLAGASNGTASAIISGSGGIGKSGAGTWTLSGANTYTGATTINSGVLSISDNNNLGANSAPVTMNGGTLEFLAASGSITHPFTIGVNGGTMVNATSSQVYFHTANNLQGSGALTLNGPGAIAQSSGNFRVDAANANYTGNLVIQNGATFEYGIANAIGSAAPVTLNGQGEFVVNNGITMPNALTVNGDGNVISFENGTTGVYSGPITLNADTTIALRDWFGWGTARGGSISGNISGNGGLTVNSGTGTGIGTLTLSGSNTYTGNTTVNSSVLAVTKTAALPGYTTSGKVSVGNTATLKVNAGGSGEFSGSDLDSVVGNVSFASGATLSVDTTNAIAEVDETANITTAGLGLTKVGAGTLSLSGVNSYTGTTTVTAGTLILTGSNSSSGATNVVGTLQLQNANAVSASAVTLNNGATLQLRNDSATVFTPASLSIASGATVSMNVDQISGGSGNVLTLGATTAFSGAGTLNVSGSNGYVLRLNAVTEGGSGTTQTFNVAGGNTLQIGTMTANTVYNVLNFTGAGSTVVDGAITQAAVNRSLAMTFNQTGTVTLSGNNNLRNNNNASDNNNTYVNVNSGVTNFNSNNAIFSNFAAPLNLNGGSIDNTSGSAVTLAGSHAISIAADFTYGGTNDLNIGNGATTLNGAAGSRTITTNGSATLTLSGAISNGSSTGLVKAGAGTLALTANSAYTGTTTVNGGTLILSGSLSGSNDVEVSAAGKLQLNTSGLITSSGTVNVNGILGLNGGASSLGKLNLNNGSTLSINITGTAANAHASVTSTGGITLATDGAGVTLTLNTTGYTPNVVLGDLGQSDRFTLTLGNGTAAVGTFANVIATSDSNYGMTLNEYTDANGNNWAIFYNVDSTAGATAYNSVGNDVVAYALAVPEPSTWAMMVGGLGMLGFFQRLRRRNG